MLDEQCFRNFVLDKKAAKKVILNIICTYGFTDPHFKGFYYCML